MGSVPSTFVALGSFLGALGVVLGAFGAHGLKSRVEPDLLVIWDTASRYHLMHALALVMSAWAAERSPGVWSLAAGWLFLAGILVFSGSLYALVLTGQRWLGAITPLGGVALILGWVALAGTAVRGR